MKLDAIFTPSSPILGAGRGAGGVGLVMQGTAPILYHVFRSRHYNLDTFDYHKRSVANCLYNSLEENYARSHYSNETAKED